MQNNTLQVVLTIAGSDPSGGAGIQADLKTFAAFSVYGAAAITCLTAQNTLGVFGLLPVDPPFVKTQIDHVLADLDVSHIKIGMLGSALVTESVCDALAEYPGEIIYDPVLVSSSGRELIDPDGYDTVKRRLLPICTVLTPNVPELALLVGEDCPTLEAILNAAGKLMRDNKKLRTVIITGGHFEPEKSIVTDHLVTRSHAAHQVKSENISHPRIASTNTHGTGCTFSAAFTACHLLTGNDTRAFNRATMYMDAVIRNSAAVRIGHGTGPLLHHLR